jgi:beta,beta-carotene 9',10'-dioxygenase
VVTYPDTAIIDQLYLKRLRAGRLETPIGGKLTRFRIDLTGNADARHETEMQFDLPRIDYQNRSGRRYRYVYGSGNEIQCNFADALVKFDLEKNHTDLWREEGCYPGEPVFVPSPDAVREDDGVVLSVVLDGTNRRSFLLILEASTYGELARASIPHHIPFGFHGNYFAG